jgi:hypothetical protein
MKIKYTEFAPNPALRNTITHQPPHIAQSLIAQGVAVHVPLPPRGSPGWAQARVEESLELSGGKPSQYDVVPPSAAGVEWTIGTLPISAEPCILRRAGFETTWFKSLVWYDAKGKERDDVRLKDCPLSIRKQFIDLLAAKDPARFELQRERLVQEQYKADSATKHGTNRFFRKLGIDV